MVWMRKILNKKIFSLVENNDPDVLVVQENSTSEKYEF